MKFNYFSFGSYLGSHIDVDQTVDEIQCNEDMPSISINQVSFLI